MRRRRRLLGITLVVVAVSSALLAGIAWFVAERFVARIEEDLAAVCATPSVPPSEGPPSEVPLPQLLTAFVGRCGLPADKPAADGPSADGALTNDAATNIGRRWCRIEQRGEMRLAADGPWQAFTAVQAYAVAEPSFVWHAQFASFRVVDRLVAGDGRLEARLFGVVPVMQAEGEAVTQAQLMRYLAEIVWVPAAIRGNRHLTWTAAGERAVIGRLQLGSVEAELRFEFDQAGDIVRASGLREREVGGRFVATPWLGTFSDYGHFGSVRVPRHGEVQWQIDGEPFVYWRGDVVALATDR